MLKQFAFCLVVLLQISFAGQGKADSWGSMVLAHCYALDDPQHREHFFVRVFWTELGGGQLRSATRDVGTPLSLENLNKVPATCVIDGRTVAFETVDYRAPTMRGGCGLCEQTGFRITVDGEAVWEAKRPVRRGDRVFNGTIDMDRNMLRVCQEHRPEALSVEIPWTQDFFTARTSILLCETRDY